MTDRQLHRFAKARSSDLVWEEMRRRIKLGQTVLDAGCGLGQWVWFLNQNGILATGLDYSEGIVRFLKHRFPNLLWTLGYIQDMPFSCSKFDHIISWGVIEHDSNGPEKALQEFRRVCKRGGTLFVTVPLDSKATRRSSHIQFPNDIDRTTFFQYFWTQKEIEGLVRQVGFRILSSYLVSQNYPVIFPRMYNWLSVRKRLIRGSTRILNIIAKMRSDSYGMVLVVAEKN